MSNVGVKHCEYCGREYYPKRKDARYCCDSHRVMANREKNRPPLFFSQAQADKYAQLQEIRNKRTEGYPRHIDIDTVVENILKLRELERFFSAAGINADKDLQIICDYYAKGIEELMDKVGQWAI